MSSAKAVPLLFLLLMLQFLLYPGCGSAPEGIKDAQRKLKILATTSIIGDVAQQVAGSWADVDVLLPPGSSPHRFNLTPRDIALVDACDILFINGLGLEQFLEPLMANIRDKTKIVSVSDSITPRRFDENDPGLLRDRHDHHGDDHYDPHVWTDPVNIKSWIAVIAPVLAAHDSVNKPSYMRNAARYLDELDRLDEWIRTELAGIPAANRNIVTDHLVFGYFCDRYGLRQIGSIIPSFSTLAEPSAREIASLEDRIRQSGVRAIFVGPSVNPTLALQLSGDTGINVVTIYTGSLSDQHGEAATYLDYMKFNVKRIVHALSANAS